MTNLILHQNSKFNQQARRRMLDNLLNAAGYRVIAGRVLNIVRTDMLQYTAEMTKKGEAAGHAN